jgi:hypothetical protein
MGLTVRRHADPFEHHSTSGGGDMGRRVNYGFEKRQREIKKQKKNEEKAERKRQEALERAEQQAADAPDEDAPDLD